MLEATTRTVPVPSHRAPLLVALWAAVGASLAFAGAATHAPPLIPLFVVTSVFGWTIAYTRGGPVREWLDALSLRGVVALHAIRLPIGAAFLWEAGRGELAPLFAERAGWGDMIVGAAAIGVALFAWQRRRVVRAFALIGLVDILIAFATGTYLLFVAKDPLMLGAIARLPYPLLPFGVVPAVMTTHLLMLARLRRR
jgi:hypothetical protein